MEARSAAESHHRKFPWINAPLHRHQPYALSDGGAYHLEHTIGRLHLGKVEGRSYVFSQGLLGSGTFEGCLVRETKLGSQRAVVPTVKGTANIIGYAKWLMDPDDTVGKGFVVT